MKLQFLPDGSDDCPLVRVYDFLPAEIGELFSALSALASGEQQSIAVHELPGVEAVVGCRLFLRSGLKDRGLVQLTAPASFECILSAGGWEDVAGLTEPFVAGSGGYQWLSTSGDAKWLISGITGGQW
jgi:hypothetical protein